MIVTRRAVIAGSGLLLGAAATPTFGLSRRTVTLHIHDSRLPGAVIRRAALATHDIADEEAQLWRSSRALTVTRGDTVTGTTRWSDWVALRGLLAERGLRQRAVVLHETAAGTVVAWEMG